MLFCKAWAWRDALDFSNAMAALNCTALGARGGIRGLEEVRALMARAPRRAHPEMRAARAGGARHLNVSAQGHTAELLEAGGHDCADRGQHAGVPVRVLARRHTRATISRAAH